MKNTLLGLTIGMVISFFGWAGMNYIFNDYTRIYNDEVIVIGRTSILPYYKSRYRVNVRTGDEEIEIESHFGQSWNIHYNGECRCVDSVKKVRSYKISLGSDQEVKVEYYYVGSTINKTTSYAEERPTFEEGIAIRNTFRKRYADLISFLL